MLPPFYQFIQPGKLNDQRYIPFHITIPSDFFLFYMNLMFLCITSCLKFPYI